MLLSLTQGGQQRIFKVRISTRCYGTGAQGSQTGLQISVINRQLLESMKCKALHKCIFKKKSHMNSHCHE